MQGQWLESLFYVLCSFQSVYLNNVNYFIFAFMKLFFFLINEIWFLEEIFKLL